MIAAMCGFLSCCVLLSHIFPVFLVMTLPRPTSTSTMFPWKEYLRGSKRFLKQQILRYAICSHDIAMAVSYYLVSGLLKRGSSAEFSSPTRVSPSCTGSNHHRMLFLFRKHLQRLLNLSNITGRERSQVLAGVQQARLQVLQLLRHPKGRPSLKWFLAMLLMAMLLRSTSSSNGMLPLSFPAALLLCQLSLLPLSNQSFNLPLKQLTLITLIKHLSSQQRK